MWLRSWAGDPRSRWGGYGLPAAMIQLCEGSGALRSSIKVFDSSNRLDQNGLIIYCVYITKRLRIRKVKRT